MSRYQVVQHGNGRFEVIGSSEHQQQVAQTATDMLERAIESPIEGMLANAMLGFLTAAKSRPPYIVAPGRGFSGKRGYSIAPQYSMGPYRADFAIQYLKERLEPTGSPYESSLTSSMVQLVVECDGHEWHERTKEQAARDKARDRYFLTAGWPVLRFTGTEVFRETSKCAEEVWLALESMADAQLAHIAINQMPLKVIS